MPDPLWPLDQILNTQHKTTYIFLCTFALLVGYDSVFFTVSPVSARDSVAKKEQHYGSVRANV